MSTLTETGIYPTGAILMSAMSNATGWRVVERCPWNSSDGRSGNWMETARGTYPECKPKRPETGGGGA